MTYSVNGNIVNVSDAAAYILSRFDTSLSTMKLQKLIFFSQGWTLALLGRRLVQTTFEAWKWGPVSYDLYHLHAGQYSVSEIPGGNALNVYGNNKLVIDAVIRNYGGLSGMQLGDLTHLPGTPWSVVRKQNGIGEGDASRVPIPDSMICEYFSRILKPTEPQSAEL